MMKRRLLVIVLALLLAACTKPTEKAEISLNLGYEVNGKSLVTDTLYYENEAGNQFLITEIQWFLSNIELKNEAGDWIMLYQPSLADTLDISRVYYIDTDIPTSQTLHSSPVKPDHYTESVSFLDWTKPTTKQVYSPTRLSQRCFGPICWAVATTT